MSVEAGPPPDGVCVVVGATGAVGRAVVERLAAADRRVLAVARDAAKLAELESDSVQVCPGGPV